tara:strand:+ start:47 stop:3016 length:2970 start_codon:yes stop_codon:yes gene_type:complete
MSNIFVALFSDKIQNFIDPNRQEYVDLAAKAKADVDEIQAMIQADPNLDVTLGASSLSKEDLETSLGQTVADLERLEDVRDQLDKIPNPSPEQKALKQKVEADIVEIGEGIGQATEGPGSESSQLTDATEQVQAKAAEAATAAKTTKDKDTEDRAAAVGDAAAGGQGIESALEIRDAVQCWLLYNTVPLAGFAEQQYAQDGQGGDLLERPGFFSNNLQPSSDTRRMSLVNKGLEGIALPGLLDYRKGTKDFINIQSHEYAQINPTLRIFKIINEANLSQEGEAVSTTQRLVEMEFSNHTTLDGIARQLQLTRPNGQSSPVFARGAEVGVKSFDWTFLGSDPFTATRDINATLKLHAQNLTTFVADRVGPVLSIKSDGSPGVEIGRGKYKYIDLLVQPRCEDDYAPECFEVRIDVGYAPIGDTGTAAMRQGVKDSIANQKDILYLVLTDHSFDVADDGSIDITVNFRGRLETIMKTRKMNVLLPYGGVLQDAIKLKVDGEDARLTVAGAESLIKRLKKDKKPDKDRIEKLEAAIADLSFQYKQIINSFILASLLKKGFIYQYTIPDAEFAIFKRYKSQLSQGGILPPKMSKNQYRSIKSGNSDAVARTVAGVATDQAGVEAAAEAVDQTYLDLNNLQRRQVNFFFLGDLLGVVLDNITGDNTITGGIEDIGWLRSVAAVRVEGFTGEMVGTKPEQKVRDAFDKFRIILGNLDLDEKVSLAHVPISVDAYSAFFTNTVLASEKTDYSFYSFVEDVLSQLVMDPLSSRCFAGLFDTGFRPRVQHYVSPNVISDDLYEDAGTGYKTLRLRDSTGEPEEVFKRGLDSDEIPALYQYMVISSEITDLDTLKGCEEQDRLKGIVHLHFGNAFGMVKKISFSKSDIEYLPEMRYAAEGNFLYNQLANVYDVNVELVGNNIFKPGQYVYINTNALGAGETWHRNDDGTSRSWANLMGLGGYHVVTEVAHSISREGFNTSIKARWVASGQRNEGEGCNT